MKKVLSVVIAIFILMSVSICASAVDLSDGIYEVPVTLMHKEDEKESFGNKYIAQTSLLEIKNGKKTVTILLTTDMKGIEFSYYTDGSLQGDTKNGTPVSNVTVAGTTYTQGFEIPVMADGDIGLLFSVPVMPMSPSARLRIDYASAKLISGEKTGTEPQVTEAETKVTDVEATNNEETESTTEAETTPTEEESVTEAISETIAEESTTADEKVTDDAEDDKGVSPVVYAVILIGIVAVAVIIGKKIKEKK